MKKIILWTTVFSLLFFACIGGENNDNTENETGRQLWLIGAVNNWSLRNPIAFTARANDVFVWEGFLPLGQLSFCGDKEPSYSGVWYGPQQSGDKPATNGLPSAMYLNSNRWDIDTPGQYAITVNIPAMQARFQYDPGDPVDPVDPPDTGKGKYGNYYEIFVGSFYDSNNDGTGDLKGIIQKLDYLNDGNPNSNTSLHIDGIWLMPINPSPSYHKYDVRDYKAIDSAYGTMKDFEDLITECNKRGIRVIIDLVVNHTSTRHTWFQSALSGSAAYQAYYNISNIKNGSTWYALGSTGKYYEAEFWDQMPDLNWDNQAVKTEFESIIDFWLGKGVAGFRLDAVKHIYSNNTSKNVEWLRWFTDYCKSKKSDVYIVGEVWDSESVIQNYYSSGVPSNFNFAAAQDKIPTYVAYSPAKNFAEFVVNWNAGIKSKNSAAIDAPFINNHDINRNAFSNNAVRAKMAASMLIFMPGNPFVYYGEELGMTGAGNDQSKRGPMVWSRTDTTGKTNGPSGNDSPYWNASSVSEQLTDANSILRFYIDALKLKNDYPSIHWGTPALLTTTADSSVAAYKVTGGTGDGDLAVVHNLSGSSQTVTISGASSVGGTLNATSASGTKPSLSGSSLTMPAYTTAIIRY